MDEKQNALEKRDFLWENLKRLPYFRALLRAVESRFYENIPLNEPVLDVGCGDGIFAETTFEEKITVGFDPALTSLREPANRKAYSSILCAAGAAMPFQSAFFSTVISNSVLEHIPDLDAVVAEIQRILKPGGLFVFCVPNDQLLKNLSISKWLDRMGLRGLAKAYRTFFNTTSRHHHAESFEVWQTRLENNGFKIEKWWHYFLPKQVHALEWGHYFGLPSLVNKKIFGKWILLPFHGNPFIPEKRLRKLYNQDPVHPEGSYTFYIVRKD